MKLDDRKAALRYLGTQLDESNEYLAAVVHRSSVVNDWFTKENCWLAIENIKNRFLAESELDKVVAEYALLDLPSTKIVGLVMAGNIPMVGFQDMAACFLAGFPQQIKLSKKDEFLLPAMVKLMSKAYPAVTELIRFEERLENFDKVIATGSNNTARYFEKYFAKVPNIIRKNRTSIAVLDGSETEEDFKLLGEDIFNYFGLGCRNVSKIFVPKGYDFEPLMENLHKNYKKIILNNKYKNNFDYNFTIFALNKQPFINNGCLIVRNSDQLFSRISELFYQEYELIDEVNAYIVQQYSTIQTIVSKQKLSVPVINFGLSQKPSWKDFPDNRNVFEFLLE